LATCQYCGAALSEDARFCPSCGRPTGFSKPSTTAGAGAPGPLPGPPGGLLSTKDFVMTKKILSIREHYEFTSRDGARLGEGDGNFLQFPAKFVVLDANNSEIMHLNGKLLSIRREFDFYDPSGNLVGIMKKKLIKLIGSEYWVEKNGGDYMRIFGNFVEHDYRMEVDRVQVAQVHRKWVSIRDQFGVSITGNVDPRIVIGVVIAVEHEEVTERRH
jgi:uncharacterized protein YxjI